MSTKRKMPDIESLFPRRRRFSRRRCPICSATRARPSWSNMAATPWAICRWARALPAISRLLKQSKVNPIVVHGGGPQIASMLKNLGIESKFEGGLRVTDQRTMEVVEMVLAGSINKEIVALINAEGEWAIGLCGKDGNMVFAKKAEQDRQGSRLEYRAGARSGLRRRAGRSRPHAARSAGPLGDDPGDRAGRAGPRRRDLQHQRRHLCGRHRRLARRQAPAVPDRRRWRAGRRTRS